jgi:hypothetical protein
MPKRNSATKSSEFAAPLGEAVQVKARVLGFDDLMGEVSADHALLLP